MLKAMAGDSAVIQAKETVMKSPRMIMSAGTLALVLAMLAACGGQPGKPGAVPASSSTRPAATPRPSATATFAPSSSAPASPSPQVVSSRVAYPWHWPNDAAGGGRVTHSYQVPPVPELISISAGHHPAEAGQASFDRMSFTFTDAFPSYRFEFTRQLVSDGSGNVIPLTGPDVLKIVFTQAQAHTADGTGSTIISQPGRPVGYPVMTDFAQAGDFEGVLTYGIGVARSIPHSNPQTAVRAYEVEKVTVNGLHRYVVAIDIAGSPS
jgi:hypothetical protein